MAARSTETPRPLGRRDHDASPIIAQVGSRLGGYRVTTEGLGQRWISSAALVDDSSVLARTVTDTKAARRIERDDLAMSYFVIGYASRVALAAVGAWVLADAVLDVSPQRTAVSLTGPKPSHLKLRPAKLLARSVRSAERLVSIMIDEHLAPFVETARQTSRVGERLLWGNVGSACAYAFESLQTESDPPIPSAAIRRRAEAFFAACPPEVRRSGQLTRVGGGWMWERNTCCLWLLAPDGSNCADCSLLTRDERRSRCRTTRARTMDTQKDRDGT